MVGKHELARIRAQVFLAGAGVMALEMVAGRLLAPRFGSSVFTWGALIGVVMAALAAGYWLGGQIADRWPRPWTLASLLLAAGAFALALPLVAPLLLAGVADVVPDPRWGPLIASVLLVGPPSLALGAVTPVAVRLTIKDLEASGSAVGSMGGLSTAGSILGTFATVFVLIPALSLPIILVVVGVLLGGVSLLTGPAPVARGAALVVLLVAAQAGQSALAPELFELSTGIEGDVLFAASTPYHELFVVEDTDPAYSSPVRTLLLGKLRHSAIYVDDPFESHLGYVDSFHLGPLLHPNATRALFIGGGAMSGPKQFLRDYPGMEVTVVEVDETVVQVARDFFAVPDSPRLTVVVEDGRRFLERDEGGWDLIVLDAYGRDYVPFHLMTVEFLDLVRARLAPGGLVVSNLIGSLEGETSRLLRSEVATMSEVFSWVRQAPTGGLGAPEVVQEVMVVASVGTPFGLAHAHDQAIAWQGRSVPYVEILNGLTDLQLPRDDIVVLRDGFAPVESYLSPITRASFTLAG